MNNDFNQTMNLFWLSVYLKHMLKYGFVHAVNDSLFDPHSFLSLIKASISL